MAVGQSIKDNVNTNVIGDISSINRMCSSRMRLKEVGDAPKSINSDRQSFVRLIDQLDEGEISWEDFQDEVKSLHEDRIDAPRLSKVGDAPKLEESFYSKPFPDCVCEKKNKKKEIEQSQNNLDNNEQQIKVESRKSLREKKSS